MTTSKKSTKSTRRPKPYVAKAGLKKNRYGKGGKMCSK